MVSPEDIGRIADEIAKEYANSPKRLTEDARSESNLAESEQGRYILELLQNADDAQVPESSNDGTKSMGEAKVIFKATEKYLYCANGGYQISREGLEAICRAFLSPKRKGAPVIGFKGVGFKSVLAFTDNPEIYWEGGGVSFSRQMTLNFLREKAPEAVKARHPDEIPVLRCPHVVNYQAALEKDSILADLLKECASVFRFPFRSETDRAKVVGKLNELKGSVLLFLNHIEVLQIQIADDRRTYSISKSAVTPQKESGTQYDEVRSSIKGEDGPSDWFISSGTFDLPIEIRDKLPYAWRETDSVRVSFAIPMKDSQLEPLSGPSFVHVFFPTDEKVPLKVLLHGTFRTNVDRRLLVQDDSLNDFIFRKSAELFRDKVIPAITENSKDPGRILDFFAPPPEGDEPTTESKTWAQVRETLKSSKFIASNGGKDFLSPSEALLSPLPTKTNEFKQLLSEKEAHRTVDETIDSTDARRQTLLRIDATVFDIVNLPEYIERNFREEPQWVATAYAYMDHVYDNLKATQSPAANNFIAQAKKRNMILLSSGEVTNTETMDNSGSIFFPPASGVAAPPNGIKLRFLDSKTYSEYAKRVAKDPRGTLFYRELGIDEYSAVPVISKGIIPALRAFWVEWPKAKLFEPEKLLEFLKSLLGEDLPSDERIEYVRLMPVPVKGLSQYAPAYRTYASAEWTGNSDLEFIYGPASEFLLPPDSGLDPDKIEQWKGFYLWLGVAWLPRILGQFGPNEENRWRSCLWINNDCPASPHSKLPGWKQYCTQVWEESKELGIYNPLTKHTVCLVSSWTLDSFAEISNDPNRAARLLHSLAINWPYYTKYLRSSVAFKGRTAKEFARNEIRSYFDWALRNLKWIPSSRLEIWGFRTPRELFFKTDTVYSRLGDMVPYIEPGGDAESDFLRSLGVRDSLDTLTPDDWWRIAIDLPRFFPTPKEKDINPIYREMMKAKGVSDERTSRTEFLNHGRVLAQVGGEYQWVDKDDVWYVESEELRKFFGKSVAIFAIRHEENRGAQIKRVFDIQALEEVITPSVVLGDLDQALSDELSRFLGAAKPFLLARTNKQRPSKEEEDASLVRRLKIIATKQLSVSYSLKIDGNEYNAMVERGTYLDKSKDSIIVDATKFEVGHPTQNDKKLCNELAVQIAYYLGADLADSFTLLVSGDEEQRYDTLNRVDVSKDDVARFDTMLKEASTPKAPLVIQQLTSGSVATKPTLFPQPKSASSGVVQVTVAPLDLWAPAELGFENPILMDSIPGESQNKDGGGGGGGGSSGPGYIPDKQARDRVDKAGVSFVVAYERERHRGHGCGPKIESREKESCGYDIHSECNQDTRLIEVKSSKGSIQVVELTAPEWDAARTNGEKFYLYRVENLEKVGIRKPNILVISNPYSKLLGEPTRFKVKLNSLKGKYEEVSLTEKTGPEKEASSQNSQS